MMSYYEYEFMMNFVNSFLMTHDEHYFKLYNEFFDEFMLNYVKNFRMTYDE